jgi:hypothetical protein
MSGLHQGRPERFVAVRRHLHAETFAQAVRVQDPSALVVLNDKKQRQLQTETRSRSAGHLTSLRTIWGVRHQAPKKPGSYVERGFLHARDSVGARRRDGLGIMRHSSSTNVPSSAKVASGLGLGGELVS